MLTAWAAALTLPVSESASMKPRWRSGVQPSWRGLRGTGLKSGRAGRSCGGRRDLSTVMAGLRGNKPGTLARVGACRTAKNGRGRSGVDAGCGAWEARAMTFAQILAAAETTPEGLAASIPETWMQGR